MRKLLSEMGHRYRLNRTDVPGKPDIAFVGKKLAIFVHGCFWHRHDCAAGIRMPKSRIAFGPRSSNRMLSETGSFRASWLVPGGERLSFGNARSRTDHVYAEKWGCFSMRSVELFAGCGGLALGIAKAGFEHELIIERDVDSVRTLRDNKKLKPFRSAQIIEEDSRELAYSSHEGIDFVSGGPPCQPFSVGESISARRTRATCGQRRYAPSAK